MTTIKRVLVLCTVIGIAGFCSAGHAGDFSNNPTLQFIADKWLQTPANKASQATKVMIFGTSCEATSSTDAAIERHGDRLSFTYNVAIDVDFKSKVDACLEGDVPEIDTQFDLTFENTANTNRISFTGITPEHCEKCRPRKSRSISGTLIRLRTNRFRIEFHGDFDGTVELEAMK